MLLLQTLLVPTAPSLSDRASLTATQSTPSSAPPSAHTTPSPRLSEYSPTFPDDFSPGPLMIFSATLCFDGLLESWCCNCHLLPDDLLPGSLSAPRLVGCTKNILSSETGTLNHLPVHSLDVALRPTILTTFWLYLFLTQPLLVANPLHTSLVGSLEFLTFLIF